MLAARPCELTIPSGVVYTRRSALDRCLRRLAFAVYSPRQSFKLSKHKGSCGLALQQLNRACHKEGFRPRRLKAPQAGLNEGSGLSANSNASSYTSSDSDLEETRSKLNASLQLNDTGVDYVQALHEAARKFQLAMEQHGSLHKNGWFAKSWLGVDHVSWIKPLAYQAAVHALLQAVLDIASRGDGGDRDTHVFVQRSISRQLTPLEESINQQFRARKSSAEKWFWSQQHPLAVASFAGLLESDPRFTTVTSVGWEGVSVCPSKASDVSLITLGLSSAAAIAKLGAAKLSCPLCFSTLMDEISRLMNILVEFLPINQVYHFTSSVGLRSQFLGNFGSRAVRYQDSGKLGGEEGAFWVDLVQQLLRGAIVREHIRTKLTSYDSIEVLERDLAVFGFFAALGRRTQSFLSTNGSVDSDERVAGLLRYLIGGSTLFYPQLASLNTYQFFIEVVCEEMDWLPFYPVSSSSAEHLFHGHSEPLTSLNLEATTNALEQCSRWIGDFMKYSTWVQQPSGARTKAFLLKSKARLDDCIQAYAATPQKSSNKRSTSAELGGFDVAADARTGGQDFDGTRKDGSIELEAYNRSSESFKRTKAQLAFDGSQKIDQLKLFDKELQGVDEALSRLERLLLEQHGPGKEHITAACTNLKTIRQLKKEVETLEASLRKKATSMLQVEKSSLQRQRRQKSKWEKSVLNVERETPKQQEKNRTSNDINKQEGITKFIPFLPSRSSNNAGYGAAEFNNTLEGDGFEQAAALALQEASTVTKEIQHFEVLRQELMDLERRIQESAGDILSDRESECQIDGDDVIDTVDGLRVSGEEAAKGDIVSKSLQKIKDTSTDVWKGTQLLATDVAAAVVLLRRSASGEELTEKEKKSLKRTLTDLASIVPIGFLMLLPVTAVGHAAILAAIQRYMPALIPSAYAHERLQLMKQLEKVKEMESADFEDESGFSSMPSDVERLGHADND